MKGHKVLSSPFNKKKLFTLPQLRVPVLFVSDLPLEVFRLVVVAMTHRRRHPMCEHWRALLHRPDEPSRGFCLPATLACFYFVVVQCAPTH
jgi:hypothetical protein